MSRYIFKNKKELGNYGESLAADYLAQAGLKIVRRNYRCPKGEVDIIARQGESLVFAEVRTRTSSVRGTAEESINFQKIQKLKNICSYYLIENNCREWPEIRFDIVAVNFSGEEYTINWIKGIY